MWRGEGGRGARGGRRFESEEEGRAGGRRGGCDRRGEGRKRSAWMATQESGEEDRAGERRGGCRSKVRVGRWKCCEGIGAGGGMQGEEMGVAEERAACGGVLVLFVGSERTEGSSQELVEQLTLHDPYPVILQSLSHTGVSVAIYVGNEHLHEVSNSVTLAENWVRTHVLSHYSATKLTTIVVGNTVSLQQKPRTPDKFGPAFCEKPFPLSHEARSPLPLLVGTASLSPFSLSSPPKSPPYGFNWPPCNPSGGRAAPNLPFFWVWCVAKPSVPAEKLQEAMDYACGEGEANCEVIRPQGNCYSPDTVVAHASYWQKNKRVGGTCSFGGSAMLINAEPNRQLLLNPILAQVVEHGLGPLPFTDKQARLLFLLMKKPPKDTSDRHALVLDPILGSEKRVITPTGKLVVILSYRTFAIAWDL
ncbi:hypothetical protein Acr_02g0013860 [Actinidia rufa]|uniref:X8 domain-containing protein n=1 Tax=Actinidia rufa TaxID=165716 RepID=A0A7J0EAD8_9ERIC|nr:hypothetical protein Acr_02g0013860 [Actinidia rufa]